MTGYDDGRFGPNDNITREQMATILYRFAQISGRDTNPDKDYSSFKDGSSVSSFADRAVKWALGSGIIKGNADGTLDPQGSVSRAVCAIMISRFTGPAPEVTKPLEEGTYRIGTDIPAGEYILVPNKFNGVGDVPNDGVGRVEVYAPDPRNPGIKGNPVVLNDFTASYTLNLNYGQFLILDNCTASPKS